MGPKPTEPEEAPSQAVPGSLEVELLRTDLCKMRVKIVERAIRVLRRRLWRTWTVRSLALVSIPREAGPESLPPSTTVSRPERKTAPGGLKRREQQRQHTERGLALTYLAQASPPQGLISF
ncbi:hypothetical protein NDU88_007917 [Pleurodeles waltl]|uniref:Uncharacterized protein n=1 Tax=Pleurodeles waltl TaxID=8319 RepID=A0AAV7U2L7_PLEWA|nr:hypothetical protein NDU88_007917 [Pleurodeles waltl]